MSKVIIISCYFGKLPNYIELFINSCGNNPLYNWVIITNNEYKNKLPSNVLFKYLEFTECVQRIKDKLKTEFICPNPYKICDYRPAYGIIFDDIINDADYWGYCDLDVIWGNLSLFIQEPIDFGYDKILSNGHLTLLKNNFQNNNTYRLQFSGINYDYVYTHKSNFGFDEQRGINKIFKENNLNFYTKNCFLDTIFQDRSKKIQFINQKNHNRQTVIYIEGKILHCWLDNNDTLQTNEYAYIHLQKRKFLMENLINKNSFVILPCSFEEINVNSYDNLRNILLDNDKINNCEMLSTKKYYIQESLLYKFHTIRYKILKSIKYVINTLQVS